MDYDINSVRAMADRAAEPSVFDRYGAAFGDVPSRAMLQAGATPAAMEAALEAALERGSPLDQGEIQRLCPRPLADYAAEEFD